MENKKKILIDISGGIIQEIFSTDPNIEVIVYDWDNIEDCGGDVVIDSPKVISEKKFSKICSEWDKKIKKINKEDM